MSAGSTAPILTNVETIGMVPARVRPHLYQPGDQSLERKFRDLVEQVTANPGTERQVKPEWVFSYREAGPWTQDGLREVCAELDRLYGISAEAVIELMTATYGLTDRRVQEVLGRNGLCARVRWMGSSSPPWLGLPSDAPEGRNRTCAPQLFLRFDKPVFGLT